MKPGDACLVDFPVASARVRRWARGRVAGERGCPRFAQGVRFPGALDLGGEGDQGACVEAAVP